MRKKSILFYTYLNYESFMISAALTFHAKYFIIKFNSLKNDKTKFIEKKNPKNHSFVLKKTLSVWVIFFGLWESKTRNNRQNKKENCLIRKFVLLDGMAFRRICHSWNESYCREHGHASVFATSQIFEISYKKLYIYFSITAIKSLF